MSGFVNLYNLKFPGFQARPDFGGRCGEVRTSPEIFSTSPKNFRTSPNNIINEIDFKRQLYSTSLIKKSIKCHNLWCVVTVSTGAESSCKMTVT